jgi:LCP family protein required for cell wall assembly
MSTTTPSGNRSTGRAQVPGSIPPPAPARVRGAASVPSRVSGPAGPGGPGGPGGGGPAGPAGPGRGGYSAGGSGAGEYRPRTRPRPRWGRIALVAALALLLLGGMTAVGGLVYYHQLDSGLARTDPFSQITDGRPAKTVKGAINILMLGSDSRDPDNKDKPGQWRTDTMIVMHIPASHDKAYLISIPRDLYVYVPKSRSNPELGDTKAKINAAFAWGGLPLAVQAIEGYTGVRMDHVVLIDFGGFKQVTDALGGVDMYIEQDVTSIHKPFRHFRKGMNHLNGEEALDYCRQRYQFPDGDFGRMRHQQQFLKALLDKAASTGTLSNPAKLNGFLQAVTKALTVDKDFSVIDMALQFRSIRSNDLTFMVSPNLGAQTVNGESVVASDKTKASALYEAVSNDTVDRWLAQSSSPSPKATD